MFPLWWSVYSMLLPIFKLSCFLTIECWEILCIFWIVVVQSLSRVWLFVTPWTAAHQASLLKFAQIHVHWVGSAIQPSHPLSPASPPALNLSQHQGLFQESRLFTSGGQSIEASASASALPTNIQSWFPLGLTGLILQSKGLSTVFWIQALYQIRICEYFSRSLASFHAL